MSLVALLLIVYFSFYVHEFGHSSAAIFSTLASHDNNPLVLSFDYALYLNKFFVPKETSTTTLYKLNEFASLYGGLFSIVYYAILFWICASFSCRIKKLRENKKFFLMLFALFIILILREVILNWFFGIDGLQVSVQNLTIALELFFDLIMVFIMGGMFYQILRVIKIGGNNKNGE